MLTCCLTRVTPRRADRIDAGVRRRWRQVGKAWLGIKDCWDQHRVSMLRGLLRTFEVKSSAVTQFRHFLRRTTTVSAGVVHTKLIRAWSGMKLPTDSWRMWEVTMSRRWLDTWVDSLTHSLTLWLTDLLEWHTVDQRVTSRRLRRRRG